MQNKFAFHLLKSRVLTGNCLVAELYRLSLLTPNDFVDVSSSAFNKLLIDFSYFKNRLEFDNFSGETEEGHQLDEKFFAIYSPFLRSFDKFLDRFYTFITDFVEFTADFASLREQFSRAKRLEELELLAAQVLYLLGLLLFMLDFKFPGSVRERIFVALYRQRVDFESRKLETLVNLLRNRREPFDTCFTSLQLDDYFLAQIYTFLRFYKGPHYGWLQNALFVTLYFESDHDTLHNQFSVMRQIIDNFFADSWILHLHIDFRVNLFEKWDRFKAASAALASTNDYQNALKMASKHLASLRAFPLPTGLLSLEKFEEYEKHLVDMNAKLRWLILHSSAEEFSSATGKKKTAAASMTNFMPKEAQKDLIVALKRLAEFEFKMGQATAHLRNNREECVQRLKQRIGDNLGQNIAFLRNSPATGGGKKRTERIISWLDSMHSSVEDIFANDENNKSTSMALSQLELLRARCSDLLQLQADESDQQQLILRQSLLVARADLHRLHNICASDDASVGELMARTDSTYLFHFVNDQCAQMEVLLREEAQSVKFIFQKVANSVPMLICGEVAAPKRKRLVSFYCKVLELRLRAVIQAIPRAIFEEMAKLNQHFSADTHVHVDKARLRDFIDLPRRRKLAELTHQIAKLALGIANTCLKQLGDVQVQPRALLCDGLRSELGKRLATILADSRQPTIFRTIQTQHVQLAQSRKAFLFVCDHVGIRDGVQIWAEQLQLAVKTILARKFVQITAVPAIGPSTATTVSSGKPEAVLERFFDFAMTATKPSACIYNPIESAWRSVSEGNAVKFTYTAFAVLDDWLLFGLGSLLGALLAHDLRDLARRLERESTIVSGLQQQQKSMAPFPVDPIKIRQLLSSPAAIADFAADGPNRELLQALARLGQYRLLLANLHLFLEAEAHSLLGIVHGARNGFARTFELTSPLTPVNDKLAQSLFANAAEFARQMPKFANLKAIKAHLFLLSLIIHFSMLGSNSPPLNSSRKRAYDFLDGFAIIQGALLLLETSPIWRRFLHSQKYLAAEEKATAKSATNPRLSLLTIQRFTDSI